MNKLLSANIAAGSIALGNVYQTLAQAEGIAYENEVNNQSRQNTEKQAAIVQGVMQIYSLDTAGMRWVLGSCLGWGDWVFPRFKLLGILVRLTYSFSKGSISVLGWC